MDIPSMTMGYDRAITIFSPEGRILQVEYARQAVKSGSTALGFVAKDGVVIIADKRVHSKLIVDNSIEKIFVVDDHIIATFSGFIPDGRVLLDEARVIAQEYKLTFGTPIDLGTLVREISNIKQKYTQFGGLRPFGVSLIFAGVDADGEPKLYMTDPSGIYYQYYAVVIGEGEGKISSKLEERFNPEKGVTIEDGIRIGLEILKDYLGKEFNINRIVAGYIKTDEKRLVLLKGKDLEKYS
ncbi:MAG TPA: archaeal proteasome endopeptidase complex subunit alpha [Candidatus Nanopusillus sp.]|nr:archaeal proteasome endopeptidase complex subunit alpha [Candidatus Nanopusillus sp.]